MTIEDVSNFGAYYFAKIANNYYDQLKNMQKVIDQIPRMASEDMVV
jgi:hypothetical protein